jgi:anti-anti-sigma factor
MDEFSIRSERYGSTAVITVSGRVDSVTAGTLDEELGKILHGDNQIVLDMKDVSYLSSAGVRSIVRAAQSAEKSGGSLKMARIPNQVMQVLENVGLAQMFQSYPSVDEAIANF